MEDIKLTNEEIARIASLYWGVNCFCPSHTVNYLAPVNENTLTLMRREGTNYGCLALIPLDQISNEHLEAARRLQFPIRSADSTLSIFLEENPWNYKPAVYTYLAMQGYAMPVFLAPNHPANRLTPIELKMAVIRTKEMKPAKTIA